MARFVKHIACSRCGSSDANAIYDDDSTHCFSCGWHTGTKKLPYEIKSRSDKQHIDIPDDLSYDYSSEAITWAAQYHITVEELIKHNVRWSKKKQQLIFLYEEIDGKDIGLVQARNFGPWCQKRYTNSGDVNRVFPCIKRASAGSSLVIVEDMMSAIKVGRQCSCMPLLGSSLPMNKLMIIYNNYKDVLVWLDHDKYRAGANIKEKLNLLGICADVVLTDLDPKCYHDGFITDVLTRLDEEDLLGIGV
jgi:Zn ribbon nucleic-acid-binding protein